MKVVLFTIIIIYNYSTCIIMLPYMAEQPADNYYYLFTCRNQNCQLANLIRLSPRTWQASNTELTGQLNASNAQNTYIYSAITNLFKWENFTPNNFNYQANSNTNTQRRVPKGNNPLHHCYRAFVCGRRRHKRSWVVPCRLHAHTAGHTGDNARAADSDDHAAGMVLDKGLNKVVERDTRFLAGTARSQLRCFAEEGRSDCTAVEQVGNSLWFIFMLVKLLVVVVFFSFCLVLPFRTSACKLRSYSFVDFVANIIFNQAFQTWFESVPFAVFLTKQ